MKAAAKFSIIHGGASLNAGKITGPFSVLVIKDDGQERKIVAQCSGIQSAEACDQRALDYAMSYGAAIENPLICEVCA